MEQDKLIGLLEKALEALAASQQLHLQLAGRAGLVPVAPVQTPLADGRTLNEWLDVHHKQLQERGLKAQTLKNKATLMKHLRRLWGNRPITALRPHEVAQGLKSFPPANTSTAGRVLRELRDVYAEAVANGWAEHNPATHLKPVAHRVKRARLTYETWASMFALAKAVPQRWVASMLLLALLTGQRRADLAKLRFDDVVVDERGQRYLRIEQQKHAGKGYGARIELPLELRLDALGMSLAEVIEHCRGSAKPGPNLLRKAGGGSIEESSLSTRFHELIVAVLGEGAHERHEWPSLHEVRSLAARMYRAEGHDVQTLLGHKRAEMTAIYEYDRGLSKHVWKRLQLPAKKSSASEVIHSSQAEAAKSP